MGITSLSMNVSSVGTCNEIVMRQGTGHCDHTDDDNDIKNFMMMMMMGLVSAAEAGRRGGAVPGAGHGERRGAARLSTGGHCRYTAARYMYLISPSVCRL